MQKNKKTRIIYYGVLSVSDSDFPLISHLQKRSDIDVVSYFYLTPERCHSGIVSINCMPPKDSIIQASEYDDMKMYANFLDLTKVYFINNYHSNKTDLRYWLLWVKVFFHMLRKKADLIHFIWTLTKLEKLLYLLPLKKVATVHDPIPHSGLATKKAIRDKKLYFKKADTIVLLSDFLRDEFCKEYDIPISKIEINKMGRFEHLDYIKQDYLFNDRKYVLFFGQIQAHKGLFYLLEAMKIVHEKTPEISLVVAGRGSFDFDISNYSNLDYVKLFNRYITASEVAGLLGNCLCTVCPYVDATQSGVVLTSLSAYVPLIVTNVGTMPDVVLDNVYGMVVPPRDKNALAQAIIELGSNQQKLDMFRKNISKNWCNDFSWDGIVEEYVNIYRRTSNK